MIKVHISILLFENCYVVQVSLMITEGGVIALGGGGGRIGRVYVMYIKDIGHTHPARLYVRH